MSVEVKAIECRDLYAAYDRGRLGEEAAQLRDVTFALPEGRSLSILGSNGSGKTTLLKALTAMVPLRGGALLYGRDVTQMRREEIASCVAVMPQLSQIYFSYTVYETVLMGRYLHVRHPFGKPSAADRDAVLRCMERVGVAELAGRQLGALSGGEQQRVFLARTFAQESPILMLDEPTNHLDLKVQAQLEEYLRSWSREPGHTLLGVFHDIPLALRLADELLLLREGRVLAYGPRDEILATDALQRTYDFDVMGYLRGILAYT